MTIHTSRYVKPEIQTADMKKVIMNHFFQNLLLQSGMVRKSRTMMGRDKTQRILFKSLSGTANTLLRSGVQADKQVMSRVLSYCQGVIKVKCVCVNSWTHQVENAEKLSA